MKINIKKFVFGAVATVAAATLVFTSVLAAQGVTTENNTEVKPEIHQKHKRDRKGFFGKGGFGFFKHDKMNKKELTEEQKAELKEKFGEKKELTDEEKAQMKEKMEAKRAEMETKMAEKKAEMEAKFAEKEAERKAKLDEKLANGEITQEQYDKMIEKKPGFAKEKMHPKKGFGRGKGICPQMKRKEAEASEGK